MILLTVEEERLLQRICVDWKRFDVWESFFPMKRKTQAKQKRDLKQNQSCHEISYKNCIVESQSKKIIIFFLYTYFMLCYLES